MEPRRDQRTTLRPVRTNIHAALAAFDGDRLMRLLVVLMLAMVGVSTDVAAQSLTVPELVERTRPEPVYKSRIRELLPPSFDTLVREADLVVHGRANPVRTYLSPDQREVYTDYEITPMAVIRHRGNPPTVSKPGSIPILVTVWGGKIVVNGIDVVVQDLNVRPLEPGDEVVLFLEKAATPDRYRIVGEIGGMFGVADQRVQSLGRGYYKEVDGRSVADLARAVNAPR